MSGSDAINTSSTANRSLWGDNKTVRDVNDSNKGTKKNTEVTAQHQTQMWVIMSRCTIVSSLRRLNKKPSTGGLVFGDETHLQV